MASANQPQIALTAEEVAQQEAEQKFQMPPQPPVSLPTEGETELEKEEREMEYEELREEWEEECEIVKGKIARWVKKAGLRAKMALKKEHLKVAKAKSVADVYEESVWKRAYDADFINAILPRLFANTVNPDTGKNYPATKSAIAECIRLHDENTALKSALKKCEENLRSAPVAVKGRSRSKGGGAVKAKPIRPVATETYGRCFARVWTKQPGKGGGKGLAKRCKESALQNDIQYCAKCVKQFNLWGGSLCGDTRIVGKDCMPHRPHPFVHYANEDTHLDQDGNVIFSHSQEEITGEENMSAEAWALLNPAQYIQFWESEKIAKNRSPTKETKHLKFSEQEYKCELPQRHSLNVEELDAK